MSQVVENSVGLTEVDAYEVGWFVESADEDVYGPVSRETLGHWFATGVVTPNTLVRHCTQLQARPLADQAELRDRIPLEQADAAFDAVDRLEESWPRKTRERLALAEGSAPCARHKRPAVQVCLRCHAPYCARCRMKPFKKQFFLCRKCQNSHYNRRCWALVLDGLLFNYAPTFIFIGVVVALGATGDGLGLAANIISLIGVALVFLRDSLFGGASPGKRLMGLRVVKSADGRTPLSTGQGIVRWLSQLIPFFNIYDVIVPYRDPLLRRMGDRWAGTRVLDSSRKLEKARAAIAVKLFKKGFQPPRNVDTTMEDLARTL